MSTAIRSSPVARAAAAWSVTSGRALGTSHAKTGAPCQDDGIWRVLPELDMLILAVSDGAGSGRLTQFASAAAIRSCCHSLEQRADSGLPLSAESLRAAAAQAAGDILALYRFFRTGMKTDLKLSDFACTLILVVLQGPRLTMLQIGDGAVVVDSPGGLKCLSPVEHREFANETTFLTSPGGLQSAFTLEVDCSAISSVAVMSDGVQHLALHYPANVPHERFFEPLFDYSRSSVDTPQNVRDAALQNFLDGDQVNDATDDDKTLILAVRSDAKTGRRLPERFPRRRGSAIFRRKPRLACGRCHSEVGTATPYCTACGFLVSQFDSANTVVRSAQEQQHTVAAISSGMTHPKASRFRPSFLPYVLWTGHLRTFLVSLVQRLQNRMG